MTVVRAVDNDKGDNGHVTYRVRQAGDDVISTSAMFVVDEQTGELVLGDVRSLDRELTAGYTVIVEARDHGQPPRTSITVVAVNVQDVNDNAPQVP